MSDQNVSVVLERCLQVERKIDELFHLIDEEAMDIADKKRLMEELEKTYLNIYIDILYPLAEAFPKEASQYGNYPFPVFSLTEKDKNVIEHYLVENISSEWKTVAQVITDANAAIKRNVEDSLSVKVLPEYFNYILKQIVLSNVDRIEVEGDINMMRYSKVRYQQ